MCYVQQIVKTVATFGDHDWGFPIEQLNFKRQRVTVRDARYRTACGFWSYSAFPPVLPENLHPDFCMRRRLQSMWLPFMTSTTPDGHGRGPRSGSRLLFLAMVCVLALATFSMVMLSSSVSLHGSYGLRRPISMLATALSTEQPLEDQPPTTNTNNSLLTKASATSNSLITNTSYNSQGATTTPLTNKAPAISKRPQDKREQAALRRMASRRAHVIAVADSLTHIAQQTSQPRGIVMPLYDGIATLGISLILELRDMGVDLPIEVPHCGDLNEPLRMKLEQHDANVRVFDVCLEASTYTIRTRSKHKLFCRNVRHCHARFRGFDIKILALLLSRFDEVMLMDADTLYFRNPMSVWHAAKYRDTGTLFFHDRMSYDGAFLALRRAYRHGITALEEFLSNFDAEPFQHLATVARPPRTEPLDASTRKPHVSYVPSEWLASSHVWNRRAGHQADSSLMLWNKKKQVRATAILGSFIANGGTGRPPSYGDKESYFIASELAGAAYAFSDYGTGAIGTDVRDSESVLCGDALHYVPEAEGGQAPAMLYINSDRIMKFNASDDLFRTRARPASVYPGRIEDRGLAQECPFDITVERLTPTEKELITRRHKFYDIALRWQGSTTS